ncbi:unnamed protein product [Callosobruchus maculatus]|uniref:Uncharacterized protein n=1 Tax=Callosobruchus maculatus TaxID=64391 RepID=A0A653DB43_CALMS|nr:unnamed protein product [Callosobruchus maculatus]
MKILQLKVAHPSGPASAVATPGSSSRRTKAVRTRCPRRNRSTRRRSLRAATTVRPLAAFTRTTARCIPSSWRPPPLWS